MMYKDIIVHVDDTKASDIRIETALALAEEFDAHLTGLYVMPIPLYPVADAMMAVPELYDQLEAEGKANAETAKSTFDSLTRTRRNACEWRAQRGHPAQVIANHARYADLLVLGQVDPSNNQGFGDMADQTVLSVGRPVLVTPSAGGPWRPAKRILVGWDASPHASRAVHDALPLLKSASTVEVLVVNPISGNARHGDVPGADIGHHLARHGVKVSAHSLTTDDISVGDMLLAQISDTGADLFVMGAYGHSRMRELVLGGVTRHMLAHMTIPTFMAH